jgi:biotin transport system substrate-specific component
MAGDRKRSLIVAQTAAFIGLVAIGSWISLPFFPVPFTIQTLFVLLSGIVMKRYAVIPLSLYILFGVMNLPVFHNGASGIGVLLGPTGGYLVGFVPAALVVGLCYERPEKILHIAGICLGEFCIFFPGAVWLSASAGLPLAQAALIGVLPFLPGDAVKAGAAYVIGERIAAGDRFDPEPGKGDGVP